MDAVGKLGEFQIRLQNPSADEITGCSAGSLAIPTIEGWRWRPPRSTQPLFGKQFLRPKVPFSQYRCRWYRTSRVLLLASCSISGMPHTTRARRLDTFISTFVNLRELGFYYDALSLGVRGNRCISNSELAIANNLNLQGATYTRTHMHTVHTSIKRNGPKKVTALRIQRRNLQYFPL